MILVDSSVWIDWFADRATAQATALDRLFEREERLVVGDLVLTEVLQGTRDERHFTGLLDRLSAFPVVRIVDRAVAVAAARHYRALRVRGITVRKTIDTLIAARCIADRVPLLYSDRDFDPFVAHCDLRSALDLPGVS